jgi:hypothetical protein
VRKPRLADWLLILAGLFPIIVVYAVHFLHRPGEGTGFIQYDQAYYLANARAVFERGNGFAYPNPFDPNPASPTIYFHWLMVVWGFFIVHLGMSPGIVYLLTLAAGAIGASYLTWTFVGIVLPHSTGYRRAGWFAFAMWGGGVACLAALVGNAISGPSLTYELLRFDPFNGWWFLSWGRNLLFATEAVYHALMLALWIALIRRQFGWALLFLTAIATTHPFTGLQALAITLTWALVTRARVSFTLGVAALAAWFAWYYGYFLGMFPSHVNLQAVWSNVPFVIRPIEALLGYGVVLALAILAIRRMPRPWSSTEWLLIVVAIVSLLLMRHDLFVPPHQPLHFTRGYLWLALTGLALPWLAAQKGEALVWAGLALLCFDSAVFFGELVKHPEVPHALYTSRDTQEMFRQINASSRDGELLCLDLDICYLAAVQTRLRPFYGHMYLTPNMGERYQAARALFEKNRPGPWLESVDFILMRKGHFSKMPAPWQRGPVVGELELWERVKSASSH